MQVGVDIPTCTLPDATAATQRMLAALAVGVPRSGLELIGTEAGATPAQVTALLDALRPALLPQSVEGAVTPLRPRVAVDGMGRSAVLLRELIPQNGMEVADDAIDIDAAVIDAAVIVARFAITPARYGAWLRRDIPHLPIVFGDRFVRIGPFVEPGDGPCLHCIELERVDADPAWPAMATQLAGKNAAAETTLGSADAATRATRILAARLRGVPGALSASSSILVDESSGLVSVFSHRIHEECRCRSPPENVTPLADLRDRIPARTSSTAGGGGRA